MMECPRLSLGILSVELEEKMLGTSAYGFSVSKRSVRTAWKVELHVDIAYLVALARFLWASVHDTLLPELQTRGSWALNKEDVFARSGAATIGGGECKCVELLL
jgi:hypothetical protein